jgi:polygalacturonase
MKNVFFLFLLFSLTLKSQDFLITKYGAKAGDGIDNTKSIQKAIDEAAKVSGNVIFPTGRFYTGTIHLKSNITIILTRNAIWSEIAPLDKFEKYRASVRSVCDMAALTNFILAMDVENITIDGEGTIDGNGERKEIKDIKDESESDTLRPWGLHFVNCKNIKIKNIFLINSSFWMQRYFNCDHVLIDGITVFNHGTTNSDGIDIDGCHDFILSNSTIDASDDAICLKSEGLRDCRDVVITNCIARSHASAIKLGTGSIGGFKHIVISNCVIAPSKSKEMVHGLKCWRGLVGLEILCVDGGVTEDIAISNLIIDSSETPIHIRLGNRLDRNWEGCTKSECSILRNLSLDNIIVRNAGPISSAITGYPGNYIENVTINNLNYEAEGSGTVNDTSLKVVENSSSYPMNRMYYSNLPSYGLYARHVKGLYLSNVIMQVKGNDARSAVVLDDVKSGKIEILKAENKSDVRPLILVANSSDINIFGEGGIGNIDKFLRVNDVNCSNIRLFNTRFDEINHPVTIKNLLTKALCKTVSYIQLDWSEGVSNASGVFEYIIMRNNELLKRSRSLSYSDYSIEENKKYTYEIISYDAEGREQTRIKKEVLTVFDTDAPVFKSCKLQDNQTIIADFSEPLSLKSVVNLSNYTLNPATTVTGVSILNEGKEIAIKVNSILPGVAYTMQISNLTDCSKKGNLILPVKISFTDSPLADRWSFEDGNVAGKIGKGIAPDRLGKPYVITNSPAINFKEDMAVSLWFKINDAHKNMNMRVLSKRKIWYEPFGYELEINPAQHRINFCGGAASPEEQGIISYSFDTLWHNLTAMICDGKAIVFIDGKEIGTDEMVANPSPNDTDLYIGSNPNGGEVFEGSIDELKIFNRALSNEEILDLFKNK